ncbi:DUF3422 family protein [Acuticoccus sp.]|uniref:DUF3422 family protein n=1 Tax=Acuticoccus sp. TaxID=1904378 RepID=UPI003B515EA2
MAEAALAERTGALPFRNHPDRAAAIGEAHARPPLSLHVPSTIHHLAFACVGRDVAGELYGAVFGAPNTTAARHTILARDGLTIKLEPHTEFTTLTLVSSDGRAPGEDLIARIAGDVPDGAELLVSLRVFVVDRATARAHPHDIGGVLRGNIDVSSSFRVGHDGFMEMHVAAPAIGPEQLGRRVQRVLELETYRVMTLIGLPTARRIGPILSQLEADLAEVTNALTYGEEGDAAILDKLQDLSARTEAMRSATRFRFSASRAYAALVDERLLSLDEEKHGERPTLSGFIRTRLAPAVRTIASTEQRQEELSMAVGRALDLLRTRVDVSMNKGNQEILRSMNERQQRQLVLSEAVESLSVIAISYYLLGLLAYPVDALLDAGVLPISRTLALGLLAPVVVIGIWSALKRVRRHWRTD